MPTPSFDPMPLMRIKYYKIYGMPATIGAATMAINTMGHIVFIGIISAILKKNRKR